MSITERRVAKLEEQYGKVVDRHDAGLSLTELRERYKGRFLAFADEVLGIDAWSPDQLTVIAALEAGLRQGIIAGGNGVGKDVLTTGWGMYEAYVNDALAILSGAGDRQVRTVLMSREVGAMWANAAGKLPGTRYQMAIRIPGRPRGGVLAFSAADPELFVGHHGKRVFVGLTEGQAITAEIFQAAQRCVVGPGCILVSCNPNSKSTAVYELAQRPAWEVFHWSALDFPNVVEKREVFPGAVTWEWVEERRQEYGTDSPFWYMAVLGQWPEVAVDALVEPAWYDDATTPERRAALEPAAQEGGRCVLSVDPARFGGDQTVVAIVQGGILRTFHSWRKVDTMGTAERVYRLSRDIAKSPAPPWGATRNAPVICDEPGIGAGVLDRLRQLRHDGARVQATGFNGWIRQASPSRWSNDRAESLWRIREGLRLGELAILPDAPELREELLTINWSLDGRGQIAIEAKDDLRRRLGRSIDHTDALAMALFHLAHDRTATAFEWRV